jgi:hypothetical protein
MEKTLERRFNRECKKRGALPLKFVSPGVRGVMDRIVLIPGGKVVFVEMKDEGETLEPLQEKRASEFRALGHTVYCLDSVTAINDFIQEVFGV